MDLRQELSQLFANGIEEKGIYLFSSVYLNTNIPHYFICIVRTDGDLLYLTCCTSKFETVSKFIETRHLPYETLVFIKPNEKDKNYPFVKDTYVNCNNVFLYTVEELTALYKKGEISYEGKINEVHYEQLLIGINESPLVDEEIKEFIPNTLPNEED